MVDRDTRASLAAAFRVHLEHLRGYRGVSYVPAGHGATASRTSRVAPTPADSASAPRPPPGVGAEQGDAIRQQAREWSAATKLEYLRRRNVGDCRRCALARTRTNIAFGVGDPDASLMFVGEAPGADEDRQGEPFVGRAGRRLTQWIETIGLRREDVYIANVLKCRPPGNRDPRPEEVDTCSPFLRAQIRAIAPRVIVALGRHAGMLLSRREHATLRQMRNMQMSYEDVDAGVRIPLIVTYHPAYALRQGGRPGEGNGSPHGFGPADETALGDLRRALAIACPP